MDGAAGRETTCREPLRVLLSGTRPRPSVDGLMRLATKAVLPQVDRSLDDAELFPLVVEFRGGRLFADSI